MIQSIEQLAEVIVHETKRACEIRIGRYTSNRNRFTTMVDDMRSEVQGNVYAQLLDKPEFWNIRGIRSTINLYIKYYQRAQGRAAGRIELIADLTEDSSNDSQGKGSEVERAMCEMAAGVERSTRIEEFTVDFHESEFYLNLSEIERAVLDLYIEGVPMQQIGKSLSVSVNVPRNALNRIKAKAAQEGVEI